MAISYTAFEGYTVSALHRYGPLAGLISAVAMFAICAPVIQPAIIFGGVFVCTVFGRLKQCFHYRYCKNLVSESQAPSMRFSLKFLFGSIYTVAVLIWLARSFVLNILTEGQKNGKTKVTAT